MIKFSQKLSISLFAATASVLSLSSGAFAGEGGAAGAAAFTIDENGNVDGVAVAASVGKNDASAAAFNDVDNSFNSAFALGSASAINITSMGDPTAAGMIGGIDTALGTAQGNELTGSATIQLGTNNGDTIATIPDRGSATTTSNNNTGGGTGTTTDNNTGDGTGTTTDNNTGDGTVPDTGDVTVPDTGDVTVPDTGDVTAPDTGDVTAPDTGDVTLPDTGDVTAPDTGDITDTVGDTVGDIGDTVGDL